MIVTLMTGKNYIIITLPEKVSGQYWLKCSSDDALHDDAIGIEGILDKWILKSNKKVVLVNNKSVIKSADLSLLSVYDLCLKRTNERACIYTEPITADRQIFNKYIIQQAACEFTLGRKNDNDIVFSNKFVTSNHAKISYDNGQFSITDLKSSNGTYVNEERTRNRVLYPGDMIYILGLKIIIGDSFLALNNPDGQVEINTKFLLPYVKQEEVFIDSETEDDEIESEYFYRSPRLKRDIETVKITVDSPPNNALENEMPIMLAVGPSMTMGMASIATAIYSVMNAISNGNINAAIPTIVMSASMLLGTMMWPLLSRTYERRRKRKREALRQKKYKEYLAKITEQFRQACSKEEEILHENHISINDCINLIKNKDRKLWERSFEQNDFLKLRVGIGNSLLSADISYSARKFLIEEDNLHEEMLALCESPKELKNVPIVTSLYDSYISGIVGQPELVKEFAKGLIIQIAALYSYDEVKLVFILDEKDSESFSFVKWLPHVWSNDRQIRFIATDINESKEISSYLEREIESRTLSENTNKATVCPYYIIFSLSKSLSVRTDMLKQIFSQPGNIHFSVVSIFDNINDLPKESTSIIEITESIGKIYDKNDITGQYTLFRPDIFVNQNITDLSIKLANIHIDTLADSYNLPPMVTFLEMFGVGKVEHLNVLARWKENDPTNSLETAIGVNTLGDTFKLDLHEKFHGPHGLVAGMTGSGKSEFIISYILSMAVNYHPHEVAFILIDYKGGGMAKAFEKLPHTAGIITNLDGASINRSLVSIESELKRRQTIFAEAGKKIRVSNIDIYKYQKLYREGAVTEPLQHLFIISDEFAELKAQQPEFMAQLISTARIGRSLGVHLILATQKPSGVVDDQIWSNSKFRICLKVQEHSDSMDMLKRPDAAELSDTGRFYLQVGYNELFEIGQSAWAGAPYYPTEKIHIEKDKNIAVINATGRTIRRSKINDGRSIAFDNNKQLDVITEYLCNIAAEEGIKVKSLWLDAIPAMIFAENIKHKYDISKLGGYNINPVIGEYDDPVRQRQCVLRLPISKDGNAIVYGAAGSGKTTFLTVAIYSLITEHTPEEVNLYILDFASETLTSFVKAPHVGDVILSFEAEKINNMFRMLQLEIVKRKKQFSSFGGDYQSFVAESKEKVPTIIVIINNFSTFSEAYEEKEAVLSYLTREGTKYGIYFILATTGAYAVRFRLLQNFKQLFTLQLNDEADYSSIVGRTDGLYPSKHKGRGLVKTDSLYEFQTAHITNESIPFGYIRRLCSKIDSEWGGERAKKVPVLPEKVNIDFILSYVHNNSFIMPIGVEKQSLSVSYFDFRNSFISLILSANNQYIDFTGALTNLFITAHKFDTTLFDVPGDHTEQFNGDITYCNSYISVDNEIVKLFDLLVHRNDTYKNAVQSGEKAPEFVPKVIVISSLSALFGMLSDDRKEKLSLILEKGELHHNITIIIAESAKNLADYAYEKWYKHHITQTDGIWVGGDFENQYHLKASTITGETKGETTADFGFSLIKGNAVKIKLLSQKEEEF